MGRKGHSFNHFPHGFALAEVVVALFIVTLAIALVAGLGQQVAQFSKSARQTGAVVDLRSKSIALVKDPDRWLAKLRGMPNFTKYNACFPEPNSTSTVIKCPEADPSIFTANPELNKVAAGYVGISAPLVDAMGEKIAGSDGNPLLLNADGAKCDGPKKTCPLRSVAYFLRFSPEKNIRPSTVRFVVRIDKNPLHTNNNSFAMKPQFITMDVSTQSTATCPSGSLKLGNLSNGNPYCVPTTQACASGTVAVGVDSSGAPVCESVPSCGTDVRHVVLNTTSGKLECTPDPSPCPVGSPYLGNFAGTDKPICSNGLSSCNNGVMMGVEEKNGSLVNKCVELPTSDCKEQNQAITFDGEKFVCKKSNAEKECPNGKVVVGINSDGSPKCGSIFSEEGPEENDCAKDEIMYGISKDGKPKCRKLESAGTEEPIEFPGVNCPPGKYLQGIEPDYTPVCTPVGTTKASSYTITKTLLETEKNIHNSVLCDSDYNIEVVEILSFGRVFNDRRLNPRDYLFKKWHNRIDHTYRDGGSSWRHLPSQIQAKFRCTLK